MPYSRRCKPLRLLQSRALVALALFAPYLSATAAPVHSPAVALSQPVIYVQSTTDTEDIRPSPRRGSVTIASTPTEIDEAETTRIVALIGDAKSFCSVLEQEYRIDCLQYHFWKIARDLPRSGDFAPIHLAISGAADDLKAVVAAFEPPDAVLIEPRDPAKPAAERIRPLAPIRPDSQARATAAYDGIVDTAATLLLRSTENSQRREAAFQQIAAAITSTKLLLRSA